MRVKYSQNFLARSDVARAIVRALAIDPEDPVLEIGPGRGMLTAELLRQFMYVTAVEIDRGLCDLLARKFVEERGFRLIAGDFLDFDFSALGPPADRKFKLIGNLPYAVVSPVLQKVLAWDGWGRAVFMVQKEVGDRLLARPATKDYGVLSISVQARCSLKKVLKVPRAAFRPAPNVDSLVLALEPLAEPLVPREEESVFFQVVKAAFAHRRKTVLNSLRYSLHLDAAVLEGALSSAGLSARARGETFSLPDFRRLAQALAPRITGG